MAACCSSKSTMAPGACSPGRSSPEKHRSKRSPAKCGLRCTGSEVIATLGGPQFRYTYANGDPVEYLIVLFKCTVSEETVSPTDFDETLALRWFACDEFLGLALPYPIELLFPHN